jgi:hypothetical protein
VSPRKLVVLTAVVAVLFAFIVLFERKMPSTGERRSKGDLYWDLPEERLTRLALTSHGETLEFERSGGEAPWRMVKPSPYPADAFAVNAVASELSDLKRAGGDSGDAKPADYGLEKPVATARLVWTDPEDPKASKTRTIEFGAGIPGTDVTAARVEGQSKVLFVPSSALASVRKPADDFRSRDVFDGSSAGVSRLEILRGRGRLLLSRKDGVWWLSEPIADLADTAEVDRLVSRLTALRVRDFLHASEDLAALSLNPPLYRVSVTGEKGVVTSVDFGATRSDGDTVYAHRDGQVLTVERDIVDELSKEAEAFRSVPLVSFARGDVAAVDASFGEESYTLTQESGGWSAKGRPVLAAAADDALNAISSLRSRGFLDEATAKALAAPAASATLKMKMGPGWTISFFPRSADTVARVSSRPGGFVLEPDAVDKLLAALRRAVAPTTPRPTKKP